MANDENNNSGCLQPIIIFCVLTGGGLLLFQIVRSVSREYKSDPNGVIFGFFAIAGICYLIMKAKKMK